MATTTFYNELPNPEIDKTCPFAAKPTEKLRMIERPRKKKKTI